MSPDVPHMLTIAALTLKKSITLFALVGPLTMIPIFLAAAEGLDLGAKTRFARRLGLSVSIALLVATFLGMPLLGLLGVSLGAMQVGGGIIVLLLAIAMVLGQETSFKGLPRPPSEVRCERHHWFRWPSLCWPVPRHSAM